VRPQVSFADLFAGTALREREFSWREETRHDQNQHADCECRGDRFDLGVTSRADVPTKKESILPPGAIIVAADEAQPAADQPARRNPTTGTTALDQNAAH
jgi:hypothetical protein